MFETLLNFLGLLLSALSAVPASRRRKLVRELVKIHQELLSVVANGQEILKTMRRYKSATSIDDTERLQETLRALLMEQESRVRKIQRVAAGKAMRNVLSIRLPKLHPLLLIALEEKGYTLHLSLATLEAIKAEMKKPEIREMIAEGMISKPYYPSQAEFELGFEGLEALDRGELQKARSQLKRLSVSAEKLRKFLGTFPIEDLV